MLAALVKCPELEIAEEEAQKLGAAIKEVNDLYDTPTIPPWVLAWGNLAMVCGTVYGPRVLAISKRIADEKVAKAGKITVIPPTPKVATPAPAPVTIEGEHIN